MVEKSKKTYETLRAMGVESPLQIDRYYITSINFVDVLRIVYDRPEDSYLPSSRVYKFPRITKGKDGSSSAEVVPKTHPTLLAALDELKSILAAKSSKATIAAEILSELELLEEDIAIRSECLKVLAKKIPIAD